MAEAQLPATSDTTQQQRPKLSCTKYFDAIYFCYSPVYQMTEYYREGAFDDCRGKWSALWDCAAMKRRPAAEVQAYLDQQARPPDHIWTFRTPEEAGKAWKEQYGHLQDPPSSGSAA